MTDRICGFTSEGERGKDREYVSPATACIDRNSYRQKRKIFPSLP